MQPEDPWAVRRELAAKLGEVYPAWNVWITERTWWATRRTPVLPADAMRFGLYMTVSADTPDELKTQLDEQTQRQRRYCSRPRLVWR